MGFIVAIPLTGTEVQVEQSEDVHGLGPGVMITGPKDNVIRMLEVMLDAAKAVQDDDGA